jgi:sacsin
MRERKLCLSSIFSGAEVVHLLLDTRTHGSVSLLKPSMASLQGPALLAFNDCAFTADDIVNIQKVANGHKKTELGQTGQFGVGFNFSYWLTEVPSFLSGGSVCFFDPSCKYVPKATQLRPGCKFNLNPETLATYPDQFSPYTVPEVGFDCTKPFTGTLFRFPLRTAAQTSEITRKCYTVQDVRNLFRSFAEGAQASLLFLRNVRRLQLSEIGAAGEQLLQPLLDVKMEERTSQLGEWHRRLSSPERQAQMVGGELWADRATDCVRVTIKGEYAAANLQGEHWWWVQHWAAVTAAVAPLMRSPSQRKRVPWAGAAALLPGRGAGPCIEGESTWPAFCTLPLTIQTGYTTVINGAWELSSSRMDIRGAAEKDGPTSEWNR